MNKEYIWFADTVKETVVKFTTLLTKNGEHKPYWTLQDDRGFKTICYNRTQIEAVVEFFNAKIWHTFQQIILEQINLQEIYGFNWATYDLEMGEWKPIDRFQQDAEMVVYPVYANIQTFKEILLQVGIKLILSKVEVYD